MRPVSIIESLTAEACNITPKIDITAPAWIVLCACVRERGPGVGPRKSASEVSTQ